MVPVADAIRLARSGAAVLASTVAAWALSAQRAAAAPADPCALMMPGHLKDVCDQTQKLVTDPSAPTGNKLIDAASDPLGSIARSAGQGASWLLGQLSTVVDGPTTKVNFTNMGFLRTYAIVFAASSILVILMWLYAVLRRVINGVEPVRAIAEAVGGLWLAVLASAFTPVVLAGVVTITDSITEAIAKAAPGAQIPGPNGTTTTSPGPGAFFTTMNSTFAGKPDDLGGDAFFIFIAVFTMIIAVFLWAELLVRVAMLYVGGVLATAVYAGLVDKHMWRHVERWVSLMAGLDVAKPVLVIVLITGESIADSGAPRPGIDSVITGLAVMGLAAFGTFSVYRMVPVVGDTLSLDRQARTGMGRSQLAQRVAGTAALMQAAIRVDGTRGTNNPITGPAAAARLRPELPPVPQTQARGANHPNSAAYNAGPTPLSGPRRPESPSSQTTRPGGTG